MTDEIDELARRPGTDNFGADTHNSNFAFPCNVCVHRHGSDREHPCNSCKHNAINEQSWLGDYEMTDATIKHYGIKRKDTGGRLRDVSGMIFWTTSQTVADEQLKMLSQPIEYEVCVFAGVMK